MSYQMNWRTAQRIEQQQKQSEAAKQIAGDALALALQDATAPITNEPVSHTESRFTSKGIKASFTCGKGVEAFLSGATSTDLERVIRIAGGLLEGKQQEEEETERNRLEAIRVAREERKQQLTASYLEDLKALYDSSFKGVSYPPFDNWCKSNNVRKSRSAFITWFVEGLK